MDAVVTQKLGGDAVEQPKRKGKNPHFVTEKALYHTQKQLSNVTGGPNMSVGGSLEQGG